ncbi:MAG: hypothetical protein JW932_01025 [Deltaproteobacteria bacterium]|nr:hypothetical protein [Deltaproteobacteria bacterium]
MTYTKVKLKLVGSQDPKPQDIKQAFPAKCGVLMGEVTDRTNRHQSIIIVASPSQNANIIADYTVLARPGPYLLFLPEGKYRIIAFKDLNNNQVCEENEFVGQLDRPHTVFIVAEQVIGGLDFEITENKNNPFVSYTDLKITSPMTGGLNSLEQEGSINLEHIFFSKEYGSMGLWNIASFIKKLGINIFGLTPYDPSKVPILFIHGSGGTPRDWEFFAEKIDNEKYQAWFFYYPTGLRLQTIADLLYEKLSVLHSRIQFEELIITAHSLGGLIARRFIDRYGANKKAFNLKLFVSLATPWAGVDSAKRAPEKGLFQYPPAWRDLAPGSPFIMDLFQKPLPPHFGFYLLFGYQSTNMLVNGGDDGTIALQSLLDHRAQSEATKCIGFNENHASILFSEEVVRYYQSILESVDGHT